jgi:ribosomal-protein-alanine N-acetyltransferase
MPRCFGLLAWEDAMPVGLGLGLDLGGECEILSLGVVPERRRRGIGAALLAAIGAVARRRGAQSLVLEVAEDNRAAKVLYAAHGFVMIGRRVHYYRRGRHSIAALVLRCPLISPPDST